MSAQSQATQQFLIWLRNNYPDIFNKIPASEYSGLNGWESLLTTVGNLAIAYDNNKTTRKQIDINIARAQAGQAPVTFDANSNPIIPPSTIAFTGSGNNTMLYVMLGLGLGGVLYFASRGRGRGRR